MIKQLIKRKKEEKKIRSFEEALVMRRSYYAIGNDSPVPDDEIVRVLHTAVKHVPSAFNSQSTRMVLLLDDEHRRLWKIVKDTLRPRIPEEVFVRTEAKIDSSFTGGHGTVLFYEDKAVVRQLQNAFPLYKDNFANWSQQTSAMHQFAVWTMLEDMGFGVSLQHYNPLIDDDVRTAWNLPADWELIAQMPFGIPLGPPQEKSFDSLEARVKIFR